MHPEIELIFGQNIGHFLQLLGTVLHMVDGSLKAISNLLDLQSCKKFTTNNVPEQLAKRLNLQDSNV
jgi:hypothetical protein